MPSTRKAFGIRLTVEEDDLITTEAERTDAPSLSGVFEGALVEFLREHERSGSAVLPVPTTRGLRNRQLVARQFRLKDETMAMIADVVARHGWSRQAIARAAMLRLATEAAARERAAAGDGSRETGAGPGADA